MFCFEGTYISVIALPPIRIVDRTPIMVPGPDLPSTLLSYNCEQLMKGLFIPKSFRGLSLCHGIDGRYYIISMREIVSHRLPAPFNGNVVRTEALMKCTKERTMDNPGLYVSRVIVPKLVEVLALTIASMAPDERNVPGIIKTMLFKNVFHKLGVNLSQIHTVVNIASSRYAETNNPSYKMIVDAGYSEMVGRTLKGFVRADCATQIANGRDTVEDRLDVCNRIANFLMTKEPSFWNKHMVPALKLKYSIEDSSFQLPHSKVHLSSSLKVMSNRIGCEYNVDEGRFNKFVDITSVRMLSCKAPAWLVSEEPRTVEDQKESVALAWRESEYSESFAVREAFTARAIVCSVLLDQEVDRARAVVMAAKARAESPDATLQEKLKYIRLLSLLMDFPMSKEDKIPIIHEFVAQIKGLVPPQGMRLQDLAHNTVRLIQASEAIKAFEEPFPVEWIEHAMKKFVSDKFVDFTFSNVHAHAMVVSEESMSEYNEERVRNYFNIIDFIRPVLKTQHKSLAETKYFTRAVAAVLDSPVAETHVDASKEAMLCVQNQADQYGYEDPRIALTLFMGSMYGARRMKDFNPEMMQLYEYMHTIVNQIKSAPNKDAELEICRAGWPMTIIYRIHMYIERQKDPDMEPLKEGIEEYLRRFGRPLYAAMHLQRMGRAFMERDYCGWLRKERAARKIERVGRGYLARRLYMYRLHREKVEDQRRELAALVQRQGRGFIIRKDLKRRQIFANLLKGAVARRRFRKTKEAIHLLDRIGRGYLGRKLMFQKQADEEARLADLARKKLIADNAIKCEDRLEEMNRRLREVALKKAMEILAEEDAIRRAREEAEEKIRQKLMEEEERHRKWSEELAARNEARKRQAAKDRDEEEQQLKAELRRPNLFTKRDCLFGDGNPLPSYDALLQRAAGGDSAGLLFQVTTQPTQVVSNLRDDDISAPGEKLVVPDGKKQVFGRFRDNTKDQRLLKISKNGAGAPSADGALDPSFLPPPPIDGKFKSTIERASNWGILFDEERYQRFLLTRYMMDETRELLLWLQYCYDSLLEADEEKFLEMKRNAAKGLQANLRMDLAATTIQCAWRCNAARFELRWRVLHSAVHCKRLYSKFMSEDQQKLKAPLSVLERQREAALQAEIDKKLHKI
eukprot:GILI01014234.1.p1 GENE.GILI01014234.1~~GILI01014234.1.p1  ORF type:complete len:1224 (-),score=256.97 GILI01014234.1:83-3499(-)